MNIKLVIKELRELAKEIGYDAKVNASDSWNGLVVEDKNPLESGSRLYYIDLNKDD